MKRNSYAIDFEKMSAPSYKLLVTTPMAAIMSSGIASNEWSRLLESLAPIYSSAAGDAQGEVNEALLTVSTALQGGDEFIRQFFSNDGLNFDQIMDISATGADVWMCKLRDGEIKSADAIKLFKTIQDGLTGTVGELRKENEMVDQLILIQDRIIEHISSLN